MSIESTRLFKVFRENYGLILATLVFVLALHPLMEHSVFIERFVGLALIFVTAAALVKSWGRRGFFYGGLVLGSATFAANLLGHHSANPALSLTGHGLACSFLVLLLVMVGIDVARHETVTRNSVMGAACIYILMAMAWARLFSIVEILVPGSFAFPHVDPASPALRDGALLYFSLITLTTMGYGDITPVAFSVRFLAALEGVIAQLFLVITMARMVSLEIAHGRSESR